MKKKLSSADRLRKEASATQILLTLILERLDGIEAQLAAGASAPAPAPTPSPSPSPSPASSVAATTPAPTSAMTKAVERAVLLEKLSRLTVKRHAVLTATLGGVNYFQIARMMECHVTTVKLHLRAALDILEIRDRNFLLISWPDLLDVIPDDDYEAKYGIGKKWWLDGTPALMAVLRATKPAKNQYTKGAT